MNNILLIEDDEVQILLIKAMLENLASRLECEFAYYIAKDGLDALDILKELIRKSEKIDLIISDLYMPKMDGVRFFEKINTSEEYASFKDAPFVIISTEFDTNKIRLALKAGITDWLCKPATQPQIDRMFVNLAFRSSRCL